MTWTRPLRAGGGAAALRVVALPHAGSGPHALLPVLSALPAGVDVLGVTLPGRAGRAGEPYRATPADPMRAVAAVLAELAELAPAPTVLFGHSMGAALAAAMAMTAPERFVGLVVSAPPATGTPTELAGRWSDEEILRILRAGGETPDEVLASGTWRRHLLDLMRADLTLGVRLAHLCAPHDIRVPVTLLGGADDVVAPPLDVPGWQARAAAGLRVRVLPGGHFYLMETGNVAEVVAEIVGLLPGAERAPTTAAA